MDTNRIRLRRALEHADLRVLLMVLFHRTGERRWLEPPYRPRRDVRLIAEEDAGLPPGIQQAIRAAAAELLADPDAGVIHVRSASRVGTWDLGLNRRRVEDLRRRLATLQR